MHDYKYHCYICNWQAFMVIDLERPIFTTAFCPLCMVRKGEFNNVSFERVD